MATANTYLQVTELDFDEIRDNLKTFLSQQDQFTDYNFEGSSLSVLLDLLAYNTHYNAYYVNMLANEMFLDTAQQRESVVSHAKLLGYTPTSSIGAQADVTIRFTNVDNTINQFTLPRKSKFSATVDDVTYTFTTPEAFTFARKDNFIKEIQIKEGDPLTHRFTATGADNERFILPNQNVDITSIVVRVIESATDSTSTDFTLASNISQVFSTSPIYFIEEADQERYEIVFGSGSLGKSIKTGNIVEVEYIVNSGDTTNGVSNFSIDFSTSGLNIGENAAAVITTNTAATGGHGPESIDSIKFNAPKHYQTQNRCIVDSDYQRIITNENPDLQSVVAFGGEDANPPNFGKVYVAVKPYGQLYTTNLRKTQLKESILDRTPLAVDPIFIDADFTYILPTVRTYYSTTDTVDTIGEVEQSIRDAIDTYASANLERFGNRLRYSKFVRQLDDIAVGSVYNNDASLKMQKRITPNTNAAEKLQVLFSNAITPGTVVSTQFTFNGFACYLDDDQNGNIRMFRYNDSRQKAYLDTTLGVVDYDTGTITIDSFTIADYDGTYFKVTVEPKLLDIIPVREQILLMSSQDAEITLVGEAA